MRDIFNGFFCRLIYRLRNNLEFCLEVFMDNDYKRKFCLGTVQLGMNYGVNNVLGRQPNTEESFAILDGALKLGVNWYDTASVYGDAEKILGKFSLAEKSILTGNPVHIISKLRPDCEDKREVVLQEVYKSLRCLQTKQLAGYLLHSASDMQRKGIVDGMIYAKEKGLVQKIGVSVYTPEEAMAAVHAGWIDMLQVPYNALDRRLDQIAFFYETRKRGIFVYARSAFLQGLLLMNPEKAESHVNGSGFFVDRFQKIAMKHGFSPREAAFIFCCIHPGVDYVVFGVEQVGQLEENWAVMSRVAEFQACYNTIISDFEKVPPKVLNPILWK